MPDTCPCPRLLLTLTPASMAALANDIAIQVTTPLFCVVQHICRSDDLAAKENGTKKEA